MQHTFREEDEFLSLQRLPGSSTTHVHPSTQYIDPIIHTTAHPFCFFAACSCHEQKEAITLVNSWVEQGLMTKDEATQYMLGRTF